MKTMLIACGAMLLVAANVTGVQAAGRGGPGVGSGPESCGYRLVERTVQVPTIVTERRVINVTECRSEVRERTITVRKLVPETRQVRDVYTVMMPVTQTRIETYHVRVPVWREVVQDVTVQVPSLEVRQGTRKVCRPIQVQETQCVTRDQGHWEEVPVCCGGYDATGAPAVAQQVHRVWKPNLVTEQVPVTVWRTETVEEPYE